MANNLGIQESKLFLAGPLGWKGDSCTRMRYTSVIAILLTIGAPVLMTPALARDVTVDGAQRHQTIGGFGTCLIAWNGRFRDLYRTETFRKPFWITEGDTGGHDWPAPIEKGIDNAPHNALVAGNCSAFVPWQITERRKSTHGLMVMDTYTSKTYTARHYTRFIHSGVVRIGAEPGFGPVQVDAFLQDKAPRGHV